MLHLFGKPYVELDGKPVDGLPVNAFLVVGLLRAKFAGFADRSELAATLRENAESTSANGYLRTLLLRTRRWGEEHGAEVFAAEGRMLVRNTAHLPSDLDIFLAIEEIDTASELDWPALDLSRRLSRRHRCRGHRAPAVAARTA